MKVEFFDNSECLKCGIVEKKMVKIGAFVMCPKCLKEEFKTEYPTLEEKERYRFWLDKWYKRIFHDEV